jgi:hypothetical protein
MKEKLFGVVITILTYLVYTWIGSFETKAGSNTKYHDLTSKIDRVDVKLDKVICYLDNKQCLIKGE